MITTVKKGGRIEIEVPSLKEGDRVEVHVTPLPSVEPFDNWEEFRRQHPRVRAFHSAQEVDEFLTELRDEWDS